MKNDLTTYRNIILRPVGAEDLKYNVSLNTSHAGPVYMSDQQLWLQTPFY